MQDAKQNYIAAGVFLLLTVIATLLGLEFSHKLFLVFALYHAVSAEIQMAKDDIIDEINS